MGKGNSFVKRIQRVDLQPNSFVILHCDPAITHQEADKLLAKIRGLVNNRFPGLIWIALPAGRVLEVEQMDEEELERYGWIRKDALPQAEAEAAGR